MPTEQDAINMMFEASQRLKELGWNNPIYCPKDGSEFDVIQIGSNGIHKAHYSGEWPLYPSYPAMCRKQQPALSEDDVNKGKGE